MSRPARAILSSKNLLYNVASLTKRANGAKLIAMVKANAYGHGIRSVGSRIADHVAMLGVASIDEALILRQIGIRTPILLAEGLFFIDELEDAINNDLEIVVHQHAHISWIKNIQPKKKVNIWIKVNTGMHRLGFTIEEVQNVYDILYSLDCVDKNIKIMSHFACSGDKSHILNQRQLNNMLSICNNLHVEKSFCNSAAIFNFPELLYDYARPGLAIYGASPINGKTAEDLGLKPVMTVMSSIIAINDVKAGATVGYNAKYKSPADGRYAIIAFGYGDGYPLCDSDKMFVMVKNVNGEYIKCHIIGQISMDMMAVDISACKTASIGDDVILWGEWLPVEEVASVTGSTPWNILTGMQNRVKFFWI